MNIAFFLIPKEQVVYLQFDCTMRQALERMEYHRYTAVPVADKNGKYVGTLTEGDLLWKLKNTPDLTFSGTEQIKIRDIPWRMTNNPVRINSEMEDLLSLAIAQNLSRWWMTAESLSALFAVVKLLSTLQSEHQEASEIRNSIRSAPRVKVLKPT